MSKAVEGVGEVDLSGGGTPEGAYATAILSLTVRAILSGRGWYYLKDFLQQVQKKEYHDFIDLDHRVCHQLTLVHSDGEAVFCGCTLGQLSSPAVLSCFVNDELKFLNVTIRATALWRYGPHGKTRPANMFHLASEKSEK